MNNLVDGAVSIAIAIVGVALLAVLVSKNAQTPQVVAAFGNAFSGGIGAAVSPVTGTSPLAGVYNNMGQFQQPIL